MRFIERMWVLASEWKRERECVRVSVFHFVCGHVCACVSVRVRVCVCTSFDQGSELLSLHKETISNCFVIASVLNKSQLEAKMSN